MEFLSCLFCTHDLGDQEYQSRFKELVRFRGDLFI
jgi:hypothetical protein